MSATSLQAIAGRDAVDRATPTRWTNPWLIVGAALLLRAVWALLVPVLPVSDSVAYDEFARSIAAGRGYAFAQGNLTVYWPVGAPALYAAVYWLFGTGGLAPAVLQALLGSFIVWQTWRLAGRMFGPVVAAGAGWLLAIWPLMIEYTTILASEMGFITLLLAALDVWTSPRLAPGRKALLWGALITAASYMRPTAWPLLVIFPVASVFFGARPQAALRMAAVSLLTAGVLFAPWVYRNYQLFDRFVLVAANGGVNLWMGNNEQSSGAYMELPHIAAANEVELDRRFGQLAVEFIKAHPLTYLRLCLQRTAITYSRESIGIVWNERGLPPAVLQPGKWVSTAYWGSMLLLAALGARQLPRLRRLAPVWPLLLLLAFLAAIPVLTVAQDRYHVPLDPLLAILGGIGLQRLAARRGPARPAPLETDAH